MTFISKLKTRKAPSLDHNFGLSEDDFYQMIELLKNGDERIFEKIFLDHFSECMNYLIRNYKCEQAEAYDISMDTLIDFRTGLFHDKYKYGNLRFLFTRMATQRLIKAKRKTANVKLLDEFFDIEQEVEFNNEEELRKLQLAWSRLDPKSQTLLKQFYIDKTKLSEIADNLNKSHCSVRKQKERAVIALKQNYFQFNDPAII